MSNSPPTVQNLTGLPLDLGSTFSKIELTERQSEDAVVAITGITLAWLQNRMVSKMEEYLHTQLTYDSNPNSQVFTIVEHERAQAQYLVLKELIDDIIITKQEVMQRAFNPSQS